MTIRILVKKVTFHAGVEGTGRSSATLTIQQPGKEAEDFTVIEGDTLDLSTTT